MAWPVATDIQARTGITVSLDGSVYKTSYGVDVDDLLVQAKAFCADYCGRHYDYGFDEAVVTEEMHDGRTIIAVDHPPIVSVSSLTWDDDALSESDEEFYVYANFIRIATSTPDDFETRRPLRQGAWPQYVKVSYTGGFSDTESGTHYAIPAGLKEVVLDLACRWLMKIDQRYRSDKNAEQVSIGEYKATWTTLTADLPEKEIADLLKRLDRMPGSVRVYSLPV